MKTGQEIYFDERLVEMFRDAEKRRHWYHRVDWMRLAVWFGCAVYCGGFWWAVARAIDKGF